PVPSVVFALFCLLPTSTMVDPSWKMNAARHRWGDKHMPETSAKGVVLELLRTGDGEWTGKTRLFKGFYFAHLYFANNNPGLLTDWPIARLPEGPGIDNAVKLFDELTNEGLLTVELIHEGPYPEYRYRLTERGKKAPAPSAAAQDAIRQAS